MVIHRAVDATHRPRLAPGHLRPDPIPVRGRGWRLIAIDGIIDNMKTAIVIVGFIFAFASVLAAQSKSSETAIRKVMETQAAAWNRGDVDGFMAGYWHSDRLVFISGTNVTRGWQPTLDRYKKSYDTRAKMGTLTFSDLEVTMLARDAAVVLGSWSLARDGDNPHGKFTLIFRKFKDGWHIVMDHTS